MAGFLTGCRYLISCSNASLGPGSAVGKKPEKWQAKQAEWQCGEGRHASGGWRHAFNFANPPFSNYLSLKCQNIKFPSGMFLLHRHVSRFRRPFPLPNPPLSLLCWPICFAVSPYFFHHYRAWSWLFKCLFSDNFLQFFVQHPTSKLRTKRSRLHLFFKFHITLILNFKFLTNPGWS